MSRNTAAPTGRERFLAHDEIIVSKTDLKGHITYANKVFLDIADYVEEEVLGRPHNLIRHPEMPRAIFHLLWEELQAGREIFAYVKNMCKNGDHYWVFAHVTPSFDEHGAIIGYHSNRRAPGRPAIEEMERLYARLRQAEASAPRPKEQLVRGRAELDAALKEAGLGYEPYCLSIWQGRAAA
ncbi:MAG: PAS domain S-box protein [Alphaproteobacteria bacterium]|nr:MAG: PAS domain S-box protein [Alphaproteobacteria bacterium]